MARPHAATGKPGLHPRSQQADQLAQFCPRSGPTRESNMSHRPQDAVEPRGHPALAGHPASAWPPVVGDLAATTLPLTAVPSGPNAPHAHTSWSRGCSGAARLRHLLGGAPFVEKTAGAYPVLSPQHGLRQEGQSSKWSWRGAGWPGALGAGRQLGGHGQLSRGALSPVPLGPLR